MRENNLRINAHDRNLSEASGDGRFGAKVGQSESSERRFGLRRPVDSRQRRPHGDSIAGTARS